jgi:hypothetical protein
MSISYSELSWPELEAILKEEPSKMQQFAREWRERDDDAIIEQSEWNTRGIRQMRDDSTKNLRSMSRKASEADLPLVSKMFELAAQRSWQSVD